ncbi:MAG: DEAD/DEAH box helicase family protein [Gammaproteobacteria bacterium]|nr:DEAD/DEAH box helicase family protein [Gammaproteobacteria bacterium]
MCNRLQKIEVTKVRLQELEIERNSLLNELNQLHVQLENIKKRNLHTENKKFSPAEKIQIFTDLFRGRLDVFPKRWENLKTGKSGYSPTCSNEWVKGKCNKPIIKCKDCPNQAFIPISEEVIRKHLVGEEIQGQRVDCTIGIYPILPDDTCWFLAVDFDKEHWQRDVSAFIKACDCKHIFPAIERSRSGNGCHVWIFFKQPIPALEARKMGSVLITLAMEIHPDIGFESYDRFFPNQDTLPAGGFGNLIALPLQRTPREKNNSLFLDKNFVPYEDQWSYLVSSTQLSVEDVKRIVNEASAKGQILGVRMPIVDESETPWETKSLTIDSEFPKDQNLPPNINIVISNQLYIEKQELPPALINKLIRLAAFQNPEFYKAQAMRLSTFGKPRIIACAENFSKHIGLPRGCFEEVIQLLKSLNIEVNIEDKRNKGNSIDTNFLGELTSEQEKSVIALAKYDTGVLAATTAFGKTVIAAHMIAKRRTNTLIIVHRKQLLDQWLERLKTFLEIDSNQIGIIGGGKRKPTGIIDIAIIQSLIRKNQVNEIVENYGQIIVDECHHLSAISFESVMRACKAKYILGLTATISRKDGHHPIIFMQCGPVRYKVDAKKQAELRPFDHQVNIRYTHFNFLPLENTTNIINQVYARIIADDGRNALIFNDVLETLQAGRSPLLLTERKDHAIHLAKLFSKFCKNVVLMTGGQSKKNFNDVKDKLATIRDDEERLLIATGRYIGEGFDDSRLDTLFLTMPISWHGTIAQYAGRLHRLHHSKKEVLIYDYVDSNVQMLVKMSEKRIKGYKKLGYIISSTENNFC